MEFVTRLIERAGFAVPSADETRTAIRAAVFTLGFAAFVIIATGIWALALDVGADAFTREPQVTLGGPLYTGAFSNLGALIWMAGLTMTIVGWASTNDPARKRMFLVGGLATAALLIDDFFLVHDELQFHDYDLPWDMYLLGALFLLGLAVPLTQRKALGLVGTLGLLGAQAGFAISGALDQLILTLSQIVEDGFKFIGICLWSATWFVVVKPWRFRDADG